MGGGMRAQRVARWLWQGRARRARLARVALVPPALAVRAAAAARAAAYRTGVLRVRRLPLPVVAVGNLAVGGAGKTPLASWIAGFYAEAGQRPAVLLRGYGGDEGQIHRRGVPEAVVIEHPDRAASAERAVAAGAQVAVLDDAFQRLDVARDLNVAVVSAESLRAPRWTLPAGPWREGWRALRRADLVVITRKAARQTAVAEVERVVRRVVPGTALAVARLTIIALRGLHSGRRLPPTALGGRRVLASAGIADPDTFARQLGRLAGEVRLAAWEDHHPFGETDVTVLLQLAHQVDYVVVTEKDAVKLGALWPVGAPEPLVAELGLRWERGRVFVERALRTALAARGARPQPESAT